MRSLSISNVIIALDHDTISFGKDMLLTLAAANNLLRNAVVSIWFGPRNQSKLHASTVSFFRNTASGIESAAAFAHARVFDGADGAEQLDEERS